MSEKISDTLKTRLLSVIDEYSKKYIGGDFIRGLEIALDAAGLLETEETEYERACRLWDEWQREPGGGITYEMALQIVPPILDELTRLKESAWTEEEANGYAMYLVGQAVNPTDSPCLLPSEWLAQRRAGKGAE